MPPVFCRSRLFSRFLSPPAYRVVRRSSSGHGQGAPVARNEGALGVGFAQPLREPSGQPPHHLRMLLRQIMLLADVAADVVEPQPPVSQV